MKTFPLKTLILANKYGGKTTLALCVGLLLSTGAKAELPATLTTTDGQTYNGVSLVRVEPDGYVVEYKPQSNAVGMAKIKFSRLSADLQKQAAYDPDKAKEFEAKVAKANEDWRQENIRLEQIAKTEKQARDAQEEQLDLQRLSALANLKMAEAGLAARGGDTDGGGYGGGYGWGSGLVAVPNSIYSRNAPNIPAYYADPLNKVPFTRQPPAYYSGKPISAPFTPAPVRAAR